MNPPIQTTPVSDHHGQENSCGGSCHDLQLKQPPAQTHDACCSPGAEGDTGSIHEKNTLLPAGTGRVRYLLDNMDCPTEERLIRAYLEPMSEVVRLEFDLTARVLTVYHRLDDPKHRLHRLLA